MKLSSILVSLAIFIVLALTQINSRYIFETGYLSYTAIFVAGILASAAMVVQFIRADRTIHFNLIDLSFFAFVVFMLLRGLLTNNSWIYSKAAVLAVVVPVYIFVKHYKSMNQIHWALIFTGVCQIIVCVLQEAGYLHNINNSFEMGGTFGNPNVLATMLLFTIISAIYLLAQTRTKMFVNFLWVYLAIALLIIISSKCRTAILGSIVIGLFVMLKLSKDSSINRIVKRGLAIVLGLMCLGFLYLVIEKSGSITGRLLIWQASFDKIAESPFWGYGISSFHRVYPEAQRIFLENNPNPAYIQVADAPQWAYNDFIELWLEGGLFAALSFLLVLGSVLYCWKSQKRFIVSSNNIAFLSVTVFFLLSAFNFTLTAWPILLIFVINLAWSSRFCQVVPHLRINLKYPLNIVMSLAFLTQCIYLGKGACQNLLFQYQFNHVESLEINRQREFYHNQATVYLRYAPFAFKYASFLSSENQRSEAIEILRSINDAEPSYQSTLMLADTYQKINDLKNATIYYKNAIKYLPNRILPRYHLFMTQLLEKNYFSADSVRREVLSLSFKGDPQLIKNIKESLCKYNINENKTGFNQ